MKKVIKRIISFLGYELNKKKINDFTVEVSDLNTPIDSIYSESPIVFEVPTQKCFNLYFFSYGTDGWNPFVETLKQYIVKKHNSYIGSYLHKYYEKYVLKTQYDLFFDLPIENAELQCPYLSNFPTDTFFSCFPWSFMPGKLKGEKHLDFSHGFQGYGPVSYEKGCLEFDRLINTYESIKKYGYLPSKGSDGEIQGFFLKKSDDYRFIIRGGLHRTAVLSVLGYDKIRATFKNDHYRVVDLADIDNWPQVKSGLYNNPIAEMIFYKYFNENGIERARSIGLI